MQTSFTETQLKNPALAEANGILRSCVHCGFCTATCPTYLALGDELDSPRGRIYLIKDMLEKGKPATAEVATHIDRCLSCLSCMTTCPSGVNYMHLVDQARAYIEQTYERPWTQRVLRSLLAAVLPYPQRLRWALMGAILAKPFAWMLPKQVRAMIALAPKHPAAPSPWDSPQIIPAVGRQRLRVALLTGCVQRAVNSDINEAAIRLLTRLGAEVVIAEGAGCCGGLTHHMGKEAQAKATAAATIRAWTAAGKLDAVVINTSGCGTTVKDYAHMFAGDPALRDDAARIATLAKDISEVIAQLGLGSRGAALPRLRVAYHAACSLQHGQKITDAPQTLLRAAGFVVVEPKDAHLCCGSAGVYNILQPEIAATLKGWKVTNLENTQPDVIAAGNIGCMVQIGTGTSKSTGTPIVHTVELLDWATGGPLPPALRGRV